MAAATHWAAAATAMGVLERGGNAFDAAVAGGLRPARRRAAPQRARRRHAGRVRHGRRPDAEVLTGRARRPPARRSPAYRDEGLDLVPGSGALAAAIPGAVDAWLLLLRDHGTWAVARRPRARDRLRPRRHPGRRRAWRAPSPRSPTCSASTGRPRPRCGCPADGRRRAGECSRNPAWAHTLRAPRRRGAGARRPRGPDRRGTHRLARGLRRRGDGRVLPHAAPALQRAPTTPACSPAHDIAALARPRGEPTPPSEFRGRRVAKTPAWGQGPALLAALAVLDGVRRRRARPVHRARRPPRARGAQARAWPTARRGSATPATSPPDVLLDRDYVAAAPRPDRRHRLARPAARRLGGRDPVLADLAVAGRRAPAHGRPTRRSASPPSPATGETRGDTCHLDVVDRWGNMVSATPCGGWLQSSPTIPGARLRAGHPAADDLAGGGPALAAHPGPPAPDHAHARRWCCATAGRCSPSARPAATSRTSGSCCTCCAPRRRLRPAAGDRRAGPALDVVTQLVLAARARARRRGGRGPARRRRCIAGLERRGHRVTPLAARWIARPALAVGA